MTAGGYTLAHRWVVTLDDGRTVFAKVATDEMTASWLRDEHVVYSVLRGASFMPGYVGFSDDGDNPVLVLEDLSAAYWPPPWTTPRIEGLLAALREMWSTPPPERTARAADATREISGGWEEIARAPEGFLSLGLCSAEWLCTHIEALRDSANGARFDGDAFLHFDVRSDNVCFRPGGDALLVDWNLTAVGDPQIDVVFWLPSLAAEGGPAPGGGPARRSAGSRLGVRELLLRPSRTTSDPDRPSRARGATGPGSDGPSLGGESDRPPAAPLAHPLHLQLTATIAAWQRSRTPT